MLLEILFEVLYNINMQVCHSFSCCCGRQKSEEQKAEIERLEQILDSKVEAEKKNIGNSQL